MKFYLGPLLLGAVPLRLRIVDMIVQDDPKLKGDSDTVPDMSALAKGEIGYLYRSLPLPAALPKLSTLPTSIRYAPQQFHRHFIDLRSSYSKYMTKFSAKTRSTLLRKIRRFSELSGGTIDIRSYRTSDDLAQFFLIARQISVKTYQEKLYKSGLPDTADFREKMFILAERDNVRAYVLFLHGNPISYLYCPEEGGRLIYQFLGYDPAFSKYSPGTVLQLLALEQIFAEGRHTLFDFTEGEGEHKRLFGTESTLCGNVYHFRRSPRSIILITVHYSLDLLGTALARIAERLGLLHRMRKILRRGSDQADAGSKQPVASAE